MQPLKLRIRAVLLTFLWIAILCSSTQILANGIVDLKRLQTQLTPINSEPKFHVFFSSTEILINRAKTIIDQAPQGLYLTVGGDRGLRAASLAPQISELVLLDLSPSLVRYNRINIELLKAPSLAEYRKLRWESDFHAWENISELTYDDFEWWKKNVRPMDRYSYYPLPEMLNRYGTDLLVDQFSSIHHKLILMLEKLHHAHEKVTRDQVFYADTYLGWQKHNAKLAEPVPLEASEWDWWHKYVGDGKEYAYAQEWAKHPETLFDYGKIIDFKTGNYLYQENLFQKLHHMAIQGKICTLLIDLSNQNDVSVLVQGVHASGLRLSVLDLDNAYREYYMGEENYMNVVHPFLKVGQANSILLTMHNHREYGAGQFSTYVGFRFENIQHWPGTFHLQHFFDKLPIELTDLINGKLYEKLEFPPPRFFTVP
jgi:hypothetical protein